MFNRAGGILMHISSLYGKYGIGSLGKSAVEFIDFLSECGYTIWQILPLSPTDGYGSPYTSISAFAGNYLLIDLDMLFNDGLIDKDSLNKCICEDIYRVNYDLLSKTRMSVLKTAFQNANDELIKKCSEFSEKNAYWLDEYAKFMAVYERNGCKPWWEWNEFSADENSIMFHKFVQFLFDKQWKQIKGYANRKGISIIGDMPFYISHNSADFYENPNLFLTDEHGGLKSVAGVPPDYFSESGQLWGNPLYNWNEMKKTDYSWWIKRLRRSFELYDVVRIDHFRGFSAFYSIPFGASDAKNGEWKKGPGLDFFKTAFKEFSNGKIIAEDLGITDSDTVDLLKSTGLYGMRVFQFGFSGDDNNPHLPSNYNKKSIAYTGTHDNNTILGWIWELQDNTRASVLGYLGFNGDWGKGGKNNTICKAIIESIWQSSSDIAIVPIQDILGYGCDTRMNTPGIAKGNWSYRITKDDLLQIDKDFFKNQNIKFGRTNPMF